MIRVVREVVHIAATAAAAAAEVLLFMSSLREEVGLNDRKDIRTESSRYGERC